MVPTCLPSPGEGLLGQEWSPHVCPIPAEGNKLQGEGPPNQVQIVWTAFYHHPPEFLYNITEPRYKEIKIGYHNQKF